MLFIYIYTHLYIYIYIVYIYIVLHKTVKIRNRAYIHLIFLHHTLHKGRKFPIILGNCFYCFCFSFFEFRSLLCPVCNLTLSRKGHSKENGNDQVFQRERLLKLVPSYFLLVKPNSIIFIEIESFFVSIIKGHIIFLVWLNGVFDKRYLVMSRMFYSVYVQINKQTLDRYF